MYELKDEEKTIAERLFPPVKKLELDSWALFRLEDRCRISLQVGQEQSVSAADTLRELSRLFWQITPDLSVEPLSEPIQPEEYEIDVLEKCITIRSAGRQGVLYALQTLRQLAEKHRCDDGISRWTVPCVRIQDRPVLKFRGLHLCFFPETPVWSMERSIRLAAAYKYNYVILEPWGTLRFRSHPEYCWQEYAQSPDFFRHLVKVGHSLGVTVCPQLNIFGHASLSRGATGKHALLDRSPEFDSLFEPDGWTFCLSNPDTRRFIQDLTEELMDIFDDPPYFHIGCDEATSAKTCIDCRRNPDYASLVREHIVYFHDLLQKRNCRTLLWFDMFLQRKDGKAIPPENKGLENVYKELPRDLIVCDVEYGYLPSGDCTFEWCVSKTCHEMGYSVVVAPWNEPTGTENLCRYAAQLGLDGMLCTTWHRNREPEMPLFYHVGGSVSWDPFTKIPYKTTSAFHRNLRFICRDMGLKSYESFGSAEYQLMPHSFQLT